MNIGKIASFLLRRVVAPAIGKAIADPRNPLDRTTAVDALKRAVEAEAMRQVGKRVG